MALLTRRVLGLIPRCLHWGGLGWGWKLVILSHFPAAAAAGGSPDTIHGYPPAQSVES